MTTSDTLSTARLFELPPEIEEFRADIDTIARL